MLTRRSDPSEMKFGIILSGKSSLVDVRVDSVEG